MSEKLGKQAREALEWSERVKGLMVRSESPEATLALELLRRERAKNLADEDRILKQAASETQSAESV